MSENELNHLYIKDLIFDPLAEPSPVEAELQVEQENRYAIVQHEEGRGQFVYRAVKKAGGKIYGPIAHRGLLIGGLRLGDLTAIKGVRFAGVMHPGYKLDAALRAIALRGSSGESLDLAVTVFENATATAAEIEKLGGTARIDKTSDGGEVLVVKITADKLAALATLAEVRHVEPTAMPRRDLDSAPGFIGLRANQQPPWQNIHNLTGRNQLLGLYDSGVDNGNTNTLVLDLRGRVKGDTVGWSNPLLRESWAGLEYDGTPESHGTFVTDIAIGDGASSDGLLAGVAPAAKAIMRPQNADSDGLTPKYLKIGLALTNAFTEGARIHNNSWDPATGAFPDLVAIKNIYSEQGSATIDAFVVANPTMLVLTSAGNSGRDGAATIGTLGCSKNSLVVGNSGNGNPPTGNRGAEGLDPNQIASGSSRGPCPGDRLKPDVVAPGFRVAARCMKSGCPQPSIPYINQPKYVYRIGTSYSTPLVAGAALLLRELVTADRNRPRATGMLLKALLINGTAQLFDFAPDNNQGWGRINLAQSIDGPAAGSVYFFDSLSEAGAAFEFTQTGQSVVFENVTFIQNSPLAMTLSWYDPPDATHSGLLINRLDLILTLPDGTIYHAGVPSMRNGVTVPNGLPDLRNNTQKMILRQTPTGACTVQVVATNIAAGKRQPFALAMYPVAQQGIQPEKMPLTQLRP